MEVQSIRSVCIDKFKKMAKLLKTTLINVRHISYFKKP